MSTRSKPLSKSELTRTLAHSQIKPTLNTNEMAALLSVKLKTFYHWCAEGRFNGCFRKRGKGMVFLTERTLDAFFNGPDWSDVT